uniref:C2H2-type domain-containing protein n=1 Tax=Sphaeramia orbicularis TaxID=375764 RepID=A0A672ZEV8_9TELE
MSELQSLKVFVNQRLTAAVDEIFGQFEKTISEYEEKMERQSKLLDVILKPEIRLTRTGLGEKIFSCQFCDKRFIWQCQLRKHKCSSNSSYRQRRAVISQAKLLSNSSTIQIKTEPNEEADADGDDCGRSEEDNLVHMKDLKNRRLADKMTKQDFTISDRGGKTKTHECSECGKTFGSRSRLKIHLRIHTREKPFSCSECGKGFTRKGYLLDHIKLHTGERPFSCPVCQKHFRLKSHVRRHVAVCHSSFISNTDSASLHTHMKLHTGEKPFICVFCQKCFKRKHHVQRHMRIHTRE